MSADAWIPLLPPDAVFYTAGPADLFTNLVTDALGDFDADGPGFDALLADTITALPALGAVGDDLQTDLDDLAADLALLTFDDIDALLADLGTAEGTVSAAFDALDVIEAFPAAVGTTVDFASLPGSAVVVPGQ